MSDIKPDLQKILAAHPGLAYLKGRCQGVRKYESRYFHLIALPAEDAYSMPSIVEVESNQRRFNAGEDAAVLVRVGGYPNNFATKDGNGDRVEIKSARVTLSAIFPD